MDFDFSGCAASIFFEVDLRPYRSNGVLIWRSQRECAVRSPTRLAGFCSKNRSRLALLTKCSCVSKFNCKYIKLRKTNSIHNTNKVTSGKFLFSLATCGVKPQVINNIFLNLPYSIKNVLATPGDGDRRDGGASSCS